MSPKMPFQTAGTMLDASVVICAHNPRTDYLGRVLDSLRNQSLSLDKWELLITDNASRVPLASSSDISWHPVARHISERELGLSYARRRGIREASADLIIFVDDDNVLDATYLAEAVKIGQEWQSLGVWASGSILGDLECQLPESLQKHRSWLPLREVAEPGWSASFDDPIPWRALGAGLCVRKKVAIAYDQQCETSSIQITGRQGISLLGSEDTEIALVCCSHGLGVGIFPQLKLTHLISQNRLTEDYFVRLVEGTCLSHALLHYKWEHNVPQSPYSMKVLLSALKTHLLYRGVDRDLRLAWQRGHAKARSIIAMDSRNARS